MNIETVQQKKALPTPGTAKPIIIENETEFTNKLIDGWSAISPEYLQHKLTQVHPGELIEAPVFRALIEKHASNAEFVLDAATGNGWFATSVLKWNVLHQLKQITGIDISPVMIDTSRSQCNYPRAEFFCGSLNSDIYDAIGINKESLDLIISSNAFDCIQNIDAVIDHLYHLLKPGSHAIVSIRHPRRNAYYLTKTIDGDFEEGAYAERWDGTGGHDVIRFFRKESTWDNLFKHSGFEIVEKVIPVIQDAVADVHPEHYQYYKNKKHPGALIYVLKKPAL